MESTKKINDYKIEISAKLSFLNSDLHSCFEMQQFLRHMVFPLHFVRFQMIFHIQHTTAIPHFSAPYSLYLLMSFDSSLMWRLAMDFAQSCCYTFILYFTPHIVHCPILFMVFASLRFSNREYHEIGIILQKCQGFVAIYIDLNAVNVWFSSIYSINNND